MSHFTALYRSKSTLFHLSLNLLCWMATFLTLWFISILSVSEKKSFSEQKNLSTFTKSTASGKLQCVWNTLKYPETDFFSVSVFRHALKKPILPGFSMFQKNALFLMWEGLHHEQPFLSIGSMLSWQHIRRNMLYSCECEWTPLTLANQIDLTFLIG